MMRHSVLTLKQWRRGFVMMPNLRELIGADQRAVTEFDTVVSTPSKTIYRIVHCVGFVHPRDGEPRPVCRQVYLASLAGKYGAGDTAEGAEDMAVRQWHRILSHD